MSSNFCAALCVLPLPPCFRFWQFYSKYDAKFLRNFFIRPRNEQTTLRPETHLRVKKLTNATHTTQSLLITLASWCRVDTLREEMKKQRKEAEHYIVTAARLIAPALDKRDWTIGYGWVCEALKVDHDNLASRMEVEQALQFLKSKNFDKAISVLKSFEKKGQSMKAMAATNLSFIYFLEGDMESANQYADLAVKNSRYNAKALVNKGNCLYNAGEFHRAKELFLEAIGVQADCVEAIYNLGLTNMKMQSPEEARQAFEKLHTIIPNNPAVIYQVSEGVRELS